MFNFKKLVILVCILSLCLIGSGVLAAKELPLISMKGRGTVEYWALPATVAIVSDTGFGAGAIATKDGYIVTARHVVGNASYADVYLNDFTRYRGRVVGYHSIDAVDIAVVKIDVFKEIELQNFETPDYEGEPGSWNFAANIHQTNVGDEVWIIGHPVGLVWSVTKGVLSAKRLWGDDGLKYLQIDAATNEGNSGGPIVNGNGQIIGIVVSSLPPWYAEGLHFGIAIDSFAEEAIMLIQKDRKRLAVITNVWEDGKKPITEPEKPQIIITLPHNSKAEEK